MAQHQESAWITQGKIEAPHKAGIIGFLFWAWGLGGLIINVMLFVSAPDRVGVGTSAYITACLLLWIGGMVMFGLGALLAPIRLDYRRPPA